MVVSTMSKAQLVSLLAQTTGYLLVVNSQKNNIVELNLLTDTVVGDVQIDSVPVDAQSSNGSA
ncbi:MAG: hypothetical protein PVS3B3_15010 [Ktedonobacteraceae bacterium]